MLFRHRVYTAGACLNLLTQARKVPASAEHPILYQSSNVHFVTMSVAFLQ